ncbi:MAG: dicarboxylate/amino acid:cation symporter, partial [Collinsella sp.]|nr:dicarboxylate/amino acid:cation symporter [Collinsella sp.]
MSGAKKKVNVTTLIVLSMVVGVVAGVIGGPSMSQIQFIGDIFFRLVQMGIVPFVMCTIIVAVGGLTPQALSGFGAKGIGIFAVSSFVAAGIALGLSLILQPGAGLGDTALVQQAVFEGETSVVTFQDTLLSFFGNNIVASMGSGAMVQCIVFAIALGLAISFWRNAHDGECLVYDFITQLAALLLNIIRAVMTIAPIGIFCYVSSMVGSLGAEVLIPLVKYLGVMALATLVMFVIYFALTAVRCRLNPIKLIKKMWPMSALALGTISSAVTLPTAMEDTKNKIGCESEIADLLLPLGMPLNSNGAAIHLAVTAITIAQIYGIT